MTKAEILDELRSAMASLFELDPAEITLESRFGEDLDLDSIDAIDLLVKMQDLTDRKIDQEAVKDVRTVGDVVDLIERSLAR